MSGKIIIATILVLSFFAVEKTYSEWLYFDSQTGTLETDVVNCIAVRNDNSKWFGTYYRDIFWAPLFTAGEDSLWTFYAETNSGIGMITIMRLACDPDGNLWLGTQTGGLVKFDGDSAWTYYDTDTSLAYLRNVSAVTTDAFGNVWVGTYGSGVGMLTPDSVWNRYDTANSPIISNQIVSIYSDRNGEIWFGTFDGISRFDGLTGWTPYDTSNSGLPGNTVRSFVEDNNGQLWIGTDDGLTVFDKDDAWQQFDTSNSGIFSNQVSDLVIDSAGYLWLAHPFDPGTPSVIPVSRFDGADEWNTYDLNHLQFINFVSVVDMAVDHGGNIWFVTDGEGITCLKRDPTEVAEVDYAPLPDEFHLSQNFPNPFNISTKIEYTLAVRGVVTINVYNLRGQLVKSIYSGTRSPGTYYVTWDGTDSRGETVASGIYFYQLDIDKRASVARKSILLK